MGAVGGTGRVIVDRTLGLISSSAHGRTIGRRHSSAGLHLLLKVWVSGWNPSVEPHSVSNVTVRSLDKKFIRTNIYIRSFSEEISNKSGQDSFGTGAVVKTWSEITIFNSEMCQGSQEGAERE